ncbi:hypothetical protein LTR62_004516 [Meristemomyces frigidus]|uniref:Ubiquitin-like domain-containing protein n=1 Tax=Meristemomyces frigidus TaxID=1508187 RepID=A0AAN7YP26_9PEZI|nr:hypothetical protein LTR62_004516 [Meristemomyces frigidus]
MSSTQPIDIVIRFSSSAPDVALSVSEPGSTSVISLKQQLRTHLSPPASESRLRFIYSGKVLTDASALSAHLRPTAPPPAAGTRSNGNDSKSAKAQGKQPVRDGDGKGKVGAAVPRVYIHCSVGDLLTAAELAIDKQSAREADEALRSQTTLDAVVPSATIDSNGNATHTTTTPAPRGFDRLLTAGFTATEITSLRTQFRAIQSHSHTPDTMPTGPGLLALEEAWLDNGSANTTTGDGVPGGFEGEDVGGLDDMLWGNLIGFFWPVGAMCWMVREEGVWSRRKQIAVLSGFLVNLTFGFLRVVN